MNGPEEKDQLQFEEKDPRMRDFEQALERAMRQVEVRPETTAKLLALADEADQKRVPAAAGRVMAMPRPRAWSRSWMGGAIAAVLAMGCFVGAHIHEQHERRVEAQHQFETAERITDETLARTRAELARQGIELEQ